ncbi:AAA family ATPase [Pelagibius litoralis]|uniref:AAA family ATPase n=1 Tax=Pelagibius litoralis TaxID=374515 RepID=A0A967F375_9PROT|nr:adenylate/guanylate cyclase domain-containing protein [Pelagibius litoralis]NIA72173.1 AAA family ATPase [Pelagibius litoralis]
MSSLYAWLQGLGLDRYAAIFAEQDIDFDLLVDLTEADLIELGMSFGDRKKMLRAIAALIREEETGEGRTVPRQVAEQRHLTVMFCDLVGSTELSIRYDPEDLRTIVRSYQDTCAGVISRLEGFIARYMGDGVLVYFGFPRAHEDDAERAIRAGLEIVEAVGRLRPQADLQLQTRVGIGTGSVVVGDLIGLGSAQEIAAVGETPNLASRLQALANPDCVVVDNTTYSLASNAFDFEDLGPQSLKGISLPAGAWRALGQRPAERRAETLEEMDLVPFVNRSGEITLMLDRWKMAQAGQGQIILLSGEAGIGKSRLLRAFAERLDGDDHIALTFHCTPYHKNNALYPLIERLRRVAGISGDDPPVVALAKLRGLFKNSAIDSEDTARLFAPLLSLKTVAQEKASGERQADMGRLLDVLLQETEMMAQHRTVLMMVEDLHWIDPTSLEFLQRLSQRLSGLRILLILTVRPEAESQMRPLFPATGLALDRLQRPECETIIRHIAQHKNFPQVLVDTIAERTDGVALFIEQLTKAVIESDAVVDLGDRYEIAGEQPALSIPTTLRGSLLARLDRYPAAREIAQTGAVIGREFSYKMLAAISGLPDAELRRALDRLVETELLYRAGAAPNATLRFKHALVQEMAYSSLLKKKRRRLHAESAVFLEDHNPQLALSEPALLAHHYTEAGLPHRAVAYRLKAGERAIRRSAMTEAVREIDLGLDLLESLTDETDRRGLELHLRVAQATALRATRGTGAPETGAAWARAQTLCGTQGNKSLLFRILYGRFLFHQGNADLQKARIFGESLLDLGRQLDEEGALLRGHSAIGRTAFGQGDFAEARHHLEQAIALSNPARPAARHEVGRPELPVLDLCYLSWTSFALGYPETALQQCWRSLEIAEGGAVSYDLVVANGNACYLHQLRQDHAAVRRCAQNVINLSTEKGFPHWRSLGVMFQGWLMAATGQSAEGIAVFQTALAEHRATGEVLEVCYFLGLLADLRGRAGAPEAGLDNIDEALDLVEQTGERWFEAELHRGRGELLLRSGGPEDPAIEACFEKALALAGRQQARLWELRAAISLGRLRLAQGRSAEARKTLEPIYRWFDPAAAPGVPAAGGAEPGYYGPGEDGPDRRDAAELLDSLAIAAGS